MVAQNISPQSTRPTRDGVSVESLDDMHCEEAVPESAKKRNTNSSARWWLSILAAAIIALPLSWLLNLAATLPFFIGLFFFALFGLFIGAACFRIAEPGRPYGPVKVLAGTTVLVLGTFGVAVIFEANSIGSMMSKEAVYLPTLDLKGEPVEQFRARVAGEVDAYITSAYPPGGWVGYIRWAVRSGRFPDGSLASVPRALTMNQSGNWFIGRLVVSVGLLAFGIASQTLPMREPAPKPS
ncbi:MAG: hypothetical protein ACYTHJ_06310 [Planctomycetota bacterium]